MGLFSNFNFPWTDLHTLNLDWLLRTVKSFADRYNPVSKSEDMTQAVGVDDSGKLYTKPAADTPHADGSNYGTVNPVASTSDMTQPVGVDGSGKLFTKPGEGGAADPPHADGTNYGTVNPVASTSDMTQPVGVDGSGKLFTKPGGASVEKTLLYSIGDTVETQRADNINLLSELSDDFNQIEFVVAAQNSIGAPTTSVPTMSFVFNLKGFNDYTRNFETFSYDQSIGSVVFREIAFMSSKVVNFGYARVPGSTTNYYTCNVLYIYGIKKEEA